MEDARRERVVSQGMRDQGSRVESGLYISGGRISYFVSMSNNLNASAYLMQFGNRQMFRMFRTSLQYQRSGDYSIRSRLHLRVTSTEGVGCFISWS